jgi:hypothetical protein
MQDEQEDEQALQSTSTDQHAVDTIEDIRAAASEKDSLEDYHPIRFLVLTGEDVASLASFDWNVIVGPLTRKCKL